ncbi:hypothetical protein FGE21_08830 [Phaeobacter sp. B1627]|nr:hypothetical protein [Phaeobacter sp. B1627]TNJ44101.1 hypothetical protein FGE21_08830 [Phaeobacter sp. B1627]
MTPSGTSQTEFTARQLDPKGLIRESYRIEGIDAGQCRSIFLDWALSAPLDQDTRAALKALLDHYGAAQADHPMTAVLREGLTAGRPGDPSDGTSGAASADHPDHPNHRPRRRGGWRSRPRD